MAYTMEPRPTVREPAGEMILAIFDRAEAIHRRIVEKRGLTREERQEAFRVRMDHAERVIDAMVPRYFGA